MTQKRNIAIIAGQLVVGGAERQLYLWLSHLDRELFQPVVLTLHPGYNDYWEKPIKALGIPVLWIPQRFNRIVRLLDIIRILRPYRPQLIHGWHLFASPYAGMAAKVLGAKSLGFIQSSYQAFSNSRQEAALSLYLVDALMINSHSSGTQLESARKRKKQKIYVVQNAVEDHFNNRSAMRQKLSRTFGISTDNIWIGSLGRLYPGKRFDLILKAIALLQNDVIKFHVILIGDGPERTKLENMADTLGIAQQVTFVGEIPYANTLLSALDIFCFASLDEGLPNAVMEAAVAGVPIVSWRIPFIEEMLKDGQTALLVTSSDFVDLKNALLKLLNSPELRVSLGTAGRNHMINEFTLDRFIRRMTDVYYDLLGIQ